MQTFLPYGSFQKSAACLDRQRLGKQRIECMQIMRTIARSKADPSAGYANHPAVKQWVGHEALLLSYLAEVVIAWTDCGFKDTCLWKTIDEFFAAKFSLTCKVPWWLGYGKYHYSHQSNLVRKNEEHYRTFFPSIKNNLPYFWPAKEEMPSSLRRRSKLTVLRSNKNSVTLSATPPPTLMFALRRSDLLKLRRDVSHPGGR